MNKSVKARPMHQIDPVDPDVVSLVTFTANEIAKKKGWVIAIKPEETKLILESVRLINAMKKLK